MPKKGQGKAKNTTNKAKHSKLMARKNNKVKLKKQLQKERLLTLKKKISNQEDVKE
jgi:hypothetical protein